MESWVSGNQAEVERKKALNRVFRHAYPVFGWPFSSVDVCMAHSEKKGDPRKEKSDNTKIQFQNMPNALAKYLSSGPSSTLPLPLALPR